MAEERKRKNSKEQCLTCERDCLQNIEFLSVLPEEMQTSIDRHSTRIRHPKGNYLFREDEPVDAIYLICSGIVKLSTWDHEGREQIVGIFSDHETIWEGIMIGGSRFPYAAVCVTDVECRKVDLHDLDEMLRNPGVALKVIELLSRKLHNANERNMLLATNAPKARVAGFLLYRSREDRRDTIELRLDEIAASIRLRPETVSRRIRELEQEGMVRRVGQSRIRIIDRSGLRGVFRKE